MAEKSTLTTIQVYRKDKELLDSKFGGIAKDSFHTLIRESCTHPENKRSYVQGELPAIGDEAITAGNETRKVGGFYCDLCGTFIFRKKDNVIRVKY